jgi:hypothetical protein
MMRKSERNLSRIATALREKLTVFASRAGTNLRVPGKADFPPSYGKSYNFCDIIWIFKLELPVIRAAPAQIITWRVLLGRGSPGHH